MVHHDLPCELRGRRIRRRDRQTETPGYRRRRGLGAACARGIDRVRGAERRCTEQLCQALGTLLALRCERRIVDGSELLLRMTRDDDHGRIRLAVQQDRGGGDECEHQRGEPDGRKERTPAARDGWSFHGLDDSVSGMTAARILYVEDNAMDVELVRHLVAGVDPSIVLRHAGSRADYLGALDEHDYSLILSDNSVADLTGQEALQIATRKCPNTPFVFFTGADMPGGDAARKAHAGAAGYLTKREFSRLREIVREHAARDSSERAPFRPERAAGPAPQDSDLIMDLEQRLEARTQQLHAANEELSAFTYTVSHDLRAPLRAIAGFSQILAEDDESQLSAMAADCLSRVRAETARMDTLLDELLRLFDLSHQELHFERLDLTAMIGQCADRLRAREPSRDIAIVVAPGMTALGDARLMGVVIENLMSNAWKYTGRRTSARVEAGVGSTGRGTAFHVADNGVGFDMAAADNLFRPFQRMHASSEFPGAGVGAATARRIVRRHGGDMWAEAEPDRGATFYFTLPAAT